MASGCVIEYRGNRGVTFRAKYRDADRAQVMETLGREQDGWTRKKAERALGAKLAEVEKGMRKPRRRTVGYLLDEFEAVALAARPRKPTLVDYRATIRNHLRPAFESDDLATLSRTPERFERYAADKLKKGLSPKTVRNHLVLLGSSSRPRVTRTAPATRTRPSSPRRVSSPSGRKSGRSLPVKATPAT